MHNAWQQRMINVIASALSGTGDKHIIIHGILTVKNPLDADVAV